MNYERKKNAWTNRNSKQKQATSAQRGKNARKQSNDWFCRWLVEKQNLCFDWVGLGLRKHKNKTST